MGIMKFLDSVLFLLYLYNHHHIIRIMKAKCSAAWSSVLMRSRWLVQSLGRLVSISHRKKKTVSQLWTVPLILTSHLTKMYHCLQADCDERKGKPRATLITSPVILDPKLRSQASRINFNKWQLKIFQEYKNKLDKDNQR